MSNEELKPCPFCGWADLNRSSNGVNNHFVTCDNCGCEGPPAKRVSQAIAEWDGRTQLEAIRAAGGEVRIGQLPEINFSNYGEDEVQALQSWAFEAHDALAAMAAERDVLDRLCQERFDELAELRSELEAARKQEPAGYVCGHALNCMDNGRLGAETISMVRHPAGYQTTPLYALPPLAGKVGVPRELSCDQILMAFEENGFRIEPGETFSAKGQIAQLLNAVGALLATPSMEVQS